MPSSSFEKKIIIKDDKAIDILIEGFQNNKNNNKKDLKNNIIQKIDKNKELLKKM